MGQEDLLPHGSAEPGNNSAESQPVVPDVATGNQYHDRAQRLQVRAGAPNSSDGPVTEHCRSQRQCREHRSYA